MTMLGLIGATALYLLFAWLISAALSAWLSERKGFGERPGLASGLLLSVVGPVIWLLWPARADSAWKREGPLPRRRSAAPRSAERPARPDPSRRDADSAEPGDGAGEDEVGVAAGGDEEEVGRPAAELDRPAREGPLLGDEPLAERVAPAGREQPDDAVAEQTDGQLAARPVEDERRADEPPPGSG